MLVIPGWVIPGWVIPADSRYHLDIDWKSVYIKNI